MFGLLARLFTRPKFTEAWCVACKSHRRVLEKEVVVHRNAKMTGSRLIGECTVCHASTSTFVAV